MPLPSPQYSSLPIGTLRSSLRSQAQVEGTQGFLPHPKKDLESSSSKRLEAQFPYHDSRAMRSSPSPRPWRPDFRGTTGDSLSSPSYLMRNPNQALPLEKTHEMPPSSPDEGLLFLHGLESNPESSLQTPNTGGLTPFRPLLGSKGYPSRLERRAESIHSL